MPAISPNAWTLAAEPGQTPAWAIWLFEKPISSSLVVAIAAVIVVVLLHQRGRGRAALIAAGVGVLLTGGVFATGRLVETDRERIVSGARQFVGAVARADTRTVAGLLDDGVIVTVNGAVVTGVGKDRIVDIAGGMGHREIERHIVRIDSVQTRRGGSGRTNIGVFVSTRSAGAATSTWSLEWRRAEDGDRWVITVIDWLTIQGQPPSGSLLRAPW